MDRIKRIEHMEQLMNKTKALLKKAEDGQQALEEAHALIQQLDEYYSSPQWMADYQADEQGLLPKELKRGVLSEDGVYNLLFLYKQLTENH